MKHKSKNGIIMKSNIKILAACSFMMASMASCDLTGINDNPANTVLNNALCR